MNWSVSGWGNVMFTDECRISLQRNDKCARGLPHLHVRFCDHCTVSKCSPRSTVNIYSAVDGVSSLARLHKASIIDDFLESGEIVDIEILAYSPDLNPIENFWDVFGCAACRRFPPLATPRNLETSLQEEWQLLYSAGLITL
ncbi:transposable element Tcb1 transposase [Trichonephila clavipes]|nr:transposable element Tcb1 transposase [Trichonephila clavipes]